MHGTGARLPFLVALAAATIAASATPACVSSRCVLSYCDGPDCQCNVGSCPEGAAFDEAARRCRCLPGRALVGNQCVPTQAPPMIASYPPPQCRPGDELDRASGLCIPHERVNQVAQNMGVNVGVGQQLGCPPGQKLVIEGSNAACVPAEQTCAVDEVWNGTACVKASTSCPPGSEWDALQARCVTAVTPTRPSPASPASPPEAAPAIDVKQWSVTSYGADGGPGAPRFCNAFAGKPWSFGVTAGSTAIVRVEVALRFPDAAIGKGSVTTAASFAASGSPVVPRGAADVLASARAVLAPLLASGGRASVSDLKTTVRCTITNAAKPLAVPATGGL